MRPLLIAILLGSLILSAGSAVGISTNNLEKSIDAMEALELPIEPSYSTKASQLKSPDAIFEFVRDRISYLPYNGHLQTPDTTLKTWSGNAVDQCLLLAAMLKAVGQSTRFVQERISSQDIGILVDGIFSNQQHEKDTVFDEDSDARAEQDKFLSAQQDHFCVQMKEGERWKQFDPVFPASASKTSSGRNRTLSSIPVRENTVITIKVHNRYRLGKQQKQQMVLNQKFNFHELGVEPVTLAHHINAQEKNGAVVLEKVQSVLKHDQTEFPGKTLSASDEGPDKSSGMPAPGKGLAGIFDAISSEADRRRPAGGELELLAEWLDIEIRSLDQPLKRFRFDVFDVKEGDIFKYLMTTIAIGFSTTPVSDNDVNRYAKEALPNLKAFLSSWEAVQKLPGEEYTPGPGDSSGRIKMFNEQFLTAYQDLAKLVVLNQLRYSDRMMGKMTESTGIVGFYATPRVVIAALEYQDGKARYIIDLVKNTPRMIVPSNRPSGWISHLQLYGSLMEASLESLSLQSFSDQKGMAVGDIFAEAAVRDVDTVFICKDSIDTLKDLSIPIKARQLIRKSILRNHSVITPVSPVTYGGDEVMAWYDFDPKTQRWTGIFGNGRHQGMAEEIGLTEEAVLKHVVGCLTGDAFQYFAAAETGVVFGLAAGFGHFIDCCIQNPGASCFDSGAVCLPAIRDAKMLCETYGSISSGMQGNPLPFIGYEDITTTLYGGDPCKKGANFGLSWYGCGQ